MKKTSEPTVRDIYNTMTDDQKKATQFLVGTAMDTLIKNIDDVHELHQMILAANDGKQTPTSSKLFRNLLCMDIYASTIKKYPADVLQRAIAKYGIGKKQIEILTKMVNPYIPHADEKEAKE